MYTESRPTMSSLPVMYFVSLGCSFSMAARGSNCIGPPAIVSTCTCKSQCCLDGVYSAFSTCTSINLGANVGYPRFGCCTLQTPSRCTFLERSPYDAPAVHRLHPDTCCHCRVPVAGTLPACEYAVSLWGHCCRQCTHARHFRRDAMEYARRL